MPVSPAEFRNALSRFASGVSVVTSRHEDGRFQGITVSAFCSVSLDPPLVLICVEKTTASHVAIHVSKAFVVNVLSSGQVDVSERFASPIADRFDGVDHTLGIGDIPVLGGCLANLECRLIVSYETGDHTVFIGEVERSAVYEGSPLLYFRSDYRLMAGG